MVLKQNPADEAGFCFSMTITALASVKLY